jgi:gliding motility-associated-like protein
MATGMAGLAYEWFDENDMSIGSGQSINVLPDSAACYYVVGTDTLGCQDADTVCVEQVGLSLDIEGDEVACYGDQVTLEVLNPEGLDVTYFWIHSGETTPVVVITAMDITTYSVIVTNADLGCVDTLNHVIDVIGFNPLDIIITADPDSIVLGETSQLTVNQDPAYDYVWSASTGELVDPIYNPVVTPTGPTTYCVTVTDFDGCTGVACTSSPGVADPFCDERDVFIPNAFTPNNSGENDMLCVRSNFIQSMELQIYNRWGDKVFSSTDINNCWDGTYNGQLLSPDVFGYYLNVTCPNGKSYFKKGNITLLH